ncbi:MAG: hypothetical protein RL114_144 [Actinomycetota bacterium]|jgi:hypothetical protein
MMNDPLLPPPPPPSAKATSKSSSVKRTTKKPATAAKILVTGLSATAVFGMAAGYALAGKSQAQKITNDLTGANGINPATEQQVQSTNPSVDSAIAPNTAAPVVTAAPQATNPPVVEVPVPQVAPATPGTSNSGWQQQQSSGSR